MNQKFIFPSHSSTTTFPTATVSQDGGSPSLSVTSQKSDAANKKSAPGTPALRNLHASGPASSETSPKSRSNDDVAKFSPLGGRRSHGESPLTASPLARRNTTEKNSQDGSNEEQQSGMNKKLS